MKKIRFYLCLSMSYWYFFYLVLLAGCSSVLFNPVILSEQGAWCWFQDPRAVYIHGEHERTYAQWVTPNGQLQIGAFDHTNGRMEKYTLKESWGVDDHNVGAFLVLPDKRLMVFYARHNQPGIYSRKASYPENILAWEDEVQISEAERITYVHPVYLSEEQTYYLFWRGPTWKPTYSTSVDGVNWQPEKILIQSANNNSEEVRPYLKVVSDNKASIHFAFTDGHPRNEPKNSVYYLKYQQGAFYRAAGEQITEIANLPIDPRDADIVYDATVTGNRAWVWDIALTPNGYPVIAYTQFPSETDHRYHYAGWDSKNWFDRELTKGDKWFPQTPADTIEPEPHYSGGISLSQSDPSTVVLSREIDGVFQLERWRTGDRGLSWQTAQLTFDLQNSVRPVFARGDSKHALPILWMYGKYTHYTNFKTGIKLLMY